MAALIGFHIWLILLINCVHTQTIYDQLDRVNVPWMKETITFNFSSTRHHATAKEQKIAAFRFIVEYFEGLSLLIDIDEFETDDLSIKGRNIIGIFPGNNYGKSEDVIYMVGASYDTKKNTAGAHNNGAGVVSMLEIARLLTSSGRKENTILFVAFDLKETDVGTNGAISSRVCCSGSRHFVQTWLQRFISNSTAEFGGAYILDSILNFNDTLKSQIVPRENFPNYKQLMSSVHADGQRGNFIFVLYRLAEEDLSVSFRNIWNFVGFQEYRYQFLELPFGVEHIQLLTDLAEVVFGADYIPFWENGLKAVMISDTAYLRGYMKKCYYEFCNEVEQITETKVLFAAKTTYTLSLAIESLISRNVTQHLNDIHVAREELSTTANPIYTECRTDVYNYEASIDMYYKFYNGIFEETSWSGAKIKCEKDGAQLLVMKNMKEFNFFENECKKYHEWFWVGLSDVKEEGVWEWVDGTNVTGDMWEICQPDDAFYGEDCAAFATVKWKLIDVDCSLKFAGYVCSCKTENINAVTAEEIVVSTDECVEDYHFSPELQLYYQYYQDPLPAKEAEDVCTNHNGTLVLDVPVNIENILLSSMYQRISNITGIGLRTKDALEIWIGLKSQVANSDECSFIKLENSNLRSGYRPCSTKLPYICAKVCGDGSKVSFGATTDRELNLNGLPKFILATEEGIKIIQLDSAIHYNVISQLDINETVYSVDYLPEGNVVFWHSRVTTFIMKTLLDLPSSHHTVFQTNDVFSDIVVDPITLKIYWSCMMRKEIWVGEIKGKGKKLLFVDRLDSPQQLKLDPLSGLMFWNNGASTMAASMDGDIVSLQEIFPKRTGSIALDNRKYIYIAYDVFLMRSRYRNDKEIVEHEAYDYSDTCFQNEHNINAFTVLNDTENTIVMVNDTSLIVIQFDISKTGLVIHSKYKLNDIQILLEVPTNNDSVEHRRNASDLNPCHPHNGGCQSFCLLSWESPFFSCVCPLNGVFLLEMNDSCAHTLCHVDNGGCSHICESTENYPYFYCACPNGYFLLKDSKTCIDNNKIAQVLYYVEKTTVWQMWPQTNDFVRTAVEIENFQTYENAGFDYDPIEKKIYWLQKYQTKHAIRRAYLNGSLFIKRSADVADLSYDLRHFTPYQIDISYFADPTDVVSFQRNTDMQNLNLDWIDRRMLFVEKKTSRIDSTDINGENSETILKLNDEECYPSYVDLDIFNGYIYFRKHCTHDSVYTQIYRTRMDGSDMKLVIQNIAGENYKHPFLVDYPYGMIYWLAGEEHRLVERSTLSGSDRKAILPSAFGLSYQALAILGDFLYVSTEHGDLGRIGTDNKGADIIFRIPLLIIALKGIVYYEKNDADVSCDAIAKCVGYNGKSICLKPEEVCDGVSHCYDRHDEIYCNSCGSSSCILTSLNLTSSKRSKSRLYQNDIAIRFTQWNSHVISKFISIHGVFSSDVDVALTYFDPNLKDSVSIIIYSIHIMHRFRQIILSDIMRDFSQLEDLVLSGENFLLKIDNTTFDSFSNLKSLQIVKPNIQILPSGIFVSLSKLLLLRVIIPTLTEIGSGAFNGLQTCKYLTISNTMVNTFYPSTFKDLIRLQYLDISKNKISTLGGDVLVHLSSLISIDVRGNEIILTDRIFEYNTLLEYIYGDNYNLCCVKPKLVTEDNCVAPKFDVSSCTDLIESTLLRGFLWLFSILAIIGNLAAMIYRPAFTGTAFRDPYSIFVGNLSFSDFLMGVYMLAVAVADTYFRGKYVWKDHYWRKSLVCNCLGILSVLSTETSVFIIALITICRYIAVKFAFPHQKISKKTAWTMSIISWIVSSTLAIVPYFFFENFYSNSGVCIALPLTPGSSTGWFYSFSIFVGFNFLTFLFVAVTQYPIYNIVKKSSALVRSPNDSRERPETKVAKKLTVVVITDCLCWIPIGIMGVLALTGYSLPRTVYAWTVVFVLPINSAINPFLYTFSDVINLKAALGPLWKSQFVKRIKTLGISEKIKTTIFACCVSLLFVSCIGLILAETVHIKDLIKDRANARTNLQDLDKAWLKISHEILEIENLLTKHEHEVFEAWSVAWPSGTYGVIKTSAGCPNIGVWEEGYRLQDTVLFGGKNQWHQDVPIDMAVVLEETSVRHEYCTITRSMSNGLQWQRGSYCIFKKGDCPKGFMVGYIFWDDATYIPDINYVQNAVNGTLPDGVYDQNTLIYYCCREDGYPSIPIYLPTSTPFYLLKKGQSCQKVFNMSVKEQWILYTCENISPSPTSEGSIPAHELIQQSWKLFYCYYFK